MAVQNRKRSIFERLLSSQMPEKWRVQNNILEILSAGPRYFLGRKRIWHKPVPTVIAEATSR